MNDFFKNKYKNEAARNWDIFYKRNTVNFFKDRHWTDREFEELKDNGEKKKLLEVGCGVGNFVFPLIQLNPNIFINCCDFSKRAIDFVKSNENYNERCNAFVCDITKDKIVDNIEENTLDIVSMIFCLSAIPPEKMDFVIQNINQVLKPGGIVLFRDYGLYDQAQLRFKPGHCVEENLYVRHDGTLAYYFSLEYLNELFTRNGFEEIENNYILKETTNRKQQITFERRFVQAKFKKI
ncbi:methyltransferase [Anaeromyces robustus]|uniref:Methyltransferase n=1 Tax=Anaeromyces robustus TaxID=1754192 RepID=A0A1Y1X3P9_9FUNG|nr:methyltransferase [Anaeromyces robustus]|eukprot:ORX80439.1 methyltransferase [Anaeromyces robustus]